MITASSSALELIHTGTRLNFEEEYLLGVQREIAPGMVLDVRYSDRRLERIVEDMQGISPEGANAGLPNQIYLIGNPSPSADYFINEIEESYNPTGPPPANCVDDYGIQTNSLSQVVGAVCGQNPDTAGLTISGWQARRFRNAGAPLSVIRSRAEQELQPRLPDSRQLSLREAMGQL